MSSCFRFRSTCVRASGCGWPDDFSPVSTRPLIARKRVLSGRDSTADRQQNINKKLWKRTRNIQVGMRHQSNKQRDPGVNVATGFNRNCNSACTHRTRTHTWRQCPNRSIIGELACIQRCVGETNTLKLCQPLTCRTLDRKRVMNHWARSSWSTHDHCSACNNCLYTATTVAAETEPKISS